MALLYCSKCVLPNTRPNLNFDGSGNNCNCATKEKKRAIDWDAREAKFKDLVSQIKRKKCQYDCVIPVSGGKDSTWQVVKAVQFGLKPLCVTWRSPVRTDIGNENLQNLISLGVDHVDFSINPTIEKKIALEAFEKKGSSVIPMHMAIHALPLKFALAFKIPMVLWGENSAFEYGGDDEELKGFEITKEWIKKYGVTNNTVASDWESEFISKSDLWPYTLPEEAFDTDRKIKGVFLGQFFKWDPVEVFEQSKIHGFKASELVKTGIYDFADIDDQFLITIHHWMKWYKFGFTRSWDNLSLEIRSERISREEAIAILRKNGLECPIHEIKMFCDYVNIDLDRFWEICEMHRNKDIWTKRDGQWVIEDFLISDFDWN